MENTNFCNTDPDPFCDARNMFDGLIEALCSQEWLHAEHGEVEQFIHKDGFELMRCLLQAHLDERARQEPDFDSVQQGTREHTYKRNNRPRQLNTMFGKVDVRRKSYSVQGVDSIFPQDAELNLSADQYSDGLRRQTAFAASEQSFDKVSESISRNTATTVAKPKPANKRVWASVEKSPLEVIEQMFAEARRRDPKQKRNWVVIVDGQPAQLKLLRRVMKKQKIKATIVLDFIHVLEYLWKAAYCFFEESSQEAEAWVKERALRILAGEASQVAAGIRRSSTKCYLNAKERENADKCADYLLKYKSYLQYDKCLADGYPIATGVIEGACRYLIKDRMDITGARWGLQGAEAVLKLRAIITSNDFEEYFKFHKGQERTRNYPFYEQIAYKMAA